MADSLARDGNSHDLEHEALKKQLLSEGEEWKKQQHKLQHANRAQCAEACKLQSELREVNRRLFVAEKNEKNVTLAHNELHEAHTKQCDAQVQIMQELEASRSMSANTQMDEKIIRAERKRVSARAEILQELEILCARTWQGVTPSWRQSDSNLQHLRLLWQRFTPSW